MSQFAFLKPEFPELFDHVAKAEQLALSDPRGACFWARLTLETAINWLYLHERSLRRPYARELAALIAEPSLTQLMGPSLVTKANYVKNQGNRAAHDSGRPLTSQDATATLAELFHLTYWLARTYAKTSHPDAGVQFEPNKLQGSLTISSSTVEEIKKLTERRAEDRKKREEAEAARMASDEARLAAEAELAALKAEFTALRQANQSRPDTHDYAEAETRDRYIDLLLAEAGWPLDQERDREFPVKGMPSTSGDGFVDYVLWGQDGKPLALIEAKRTKKDAMVGQQQAKLYADCLEAAYGQRPVIFCSNGYDHWIWDDKFYPPRRISGFLKRDELELLIQRRDTRKALSQEAIDNAIAGRPYQTRAIRRVGETLEKDRQRKALLVMATGSGKTRTVIALIDQLMRANLVRRVLFLADRVALVKQAQNAFKTHLPSAPIANLLESHNGTNNDHKGARVLVSTYPTMMGQIEEMTDGQRRFGPGHFDLIVIDEAHRSVYRKYRAIFSYFDSLLLGLTATPRDEIDRDTYSLFELEKGVPTDAYDLEDAVKDGYLVPPKGISVPLKFQRQGIAYDQLSDEEKDEWDALEWDEDGTIPDRVDASDLNKWLFNIDTVDKVLAQLMSEGIKVEGGDKLGKTIIFARSSLHAQFIVQRFDANYPHLAGQFARLIDYSVTYAQSLIDDFSDPNKFPQIAVSVDMLDTGIDVPEVVNLVFFKPVRSKTKFWQMVGRGTRLCENLFGPSQDKEEFIIFDYCQNLEFFGENPNMVEPSMAAPIGERLFKSRLDLITEINSDKEEERDLRRSLIERLQLEVSGINPDNFIVRPHRRAVERFQVQEAWNTLDVDAINALKSEIAGLPTAFKDDSLPAKQFDLLILRAQIALLKKDPAFLQSQKRIREIASALEALQNVPLVAKEIELILEIQTDEYWPDVTIVMLEQVRRKLRTLVELIQPEERKLVTTDFEDEIGVSTTIDLPQVGSGFDKARFKKKARAFAEQHKDHITIQKIRRGEQLTPLDIAEVERIFLENGIANADDIVEVQNEGGLGAFLRSLVGLDRAAAKDAFSDFISDKSVSANQIEFIDMIVNALSENGLIDPEMFYESPFTDIDDQGIVGVFGIEKAKAIINIVRRLNEAVAA